MGPVQTSDKLLYARASFQLLPSCQKKRVLLFVLLFGGTFVSFSAFVSFSNILVRFSASYIIFMGESLNFHLKNVHVATGKGNHSVSF